MDTNRPPSILHILEPARAGVPSYVNLLGSTLADRGYRQHVLTGIDQEWDFASWAESVHRHEWHRTIGSTWAVASIARRVVANTSVDLVHAHATWAGLASRTRSLARPVAYQPHGWGRDSVEGQAAKMFASSVEQLLAPRSDRLLLLSDAEASAAPRTRHIDRVRPMVDLAGFSPIDQAARYSLRDRLGWPTDRPIALCVGEISARKRQSELVEAWVRLADERVELVIVGAGDGDRSGTLRDALGPATRWLGWRDDVAQLMTAADYLVIASSGEGFSLVIPEALASGLVVFSTDVGGSEAVEPTDGVIATNIDAVVRSVLAADPTLCGDDARRSRSSRAVSRYALGAAADEIVLIYDQMLVR